MKSKAPFTPLPEGQSLTMQEALEAGPGSQLALELEAP